MRVLLAEPTRVMRDSNSFVAMGRRLSSCIDIRYVTAQSPQRASAYLIADDRAIVYRLRADTWDGVVDLTTRAVLNARARGLKLPEPAAAEAPVAKAKTVKTPATKSSGRKIHTTRHPTTTRTPKAPAKS